MGIAPKPAADTKPKTPSGGWRKSMGSSGGSAAGPARVPVVPVPVTVQPVAPKLPETTFRYVGGWMGAGNDVHSAAMTLDEARAWALQHPECAGFTCSSSAAPWRARFSDERCPSRPEAARSEVEARSKRALLI